MKSFPGLRLGSKNNEAFPGFEIWSCNDFVCWISVTFSRLVDYNDVLYGTILANVDSEWKQVSKQATSISCLQMKMIDSAFRYLVVILLITVVKAADISPINIPYSGAVQSCSGQYRDSSSYSCQSCPTNQEVDPNTLGGDGQYSGCRCRQGFATVRNDCSGVSIPQKFFRAFCCCCLLLLLSCACCR